MLSEWEQARRNAHGESRWDGRFAEASSSTFPAAAFRRKYHYRPDPTNDGVLLKYQDFTAPLHPNHQEAVAGMPIPLSKSQQLKYVDSRLLEEDNDDEGVTRFLDNMRREARLPHQSVSHLNTKNFDMQELKEIQFAELSKLADSIEGSYVPLKLKKKRRRTPAQQNKECLHLLQGKSARGAEVVNAAVQAAHDKYEQRMTKAREQPYLQEGNSLRAKLKYTHPIGPRWPRDKGAVDSNFPENNIAKGRARKVPNAKKA